MFKHILLPTDGTAGSQRAVRRGMLLARVLGARVTSIYVTPPYPLIYAADAHAISPRQSKDRREIPGAGGAGRQEGRHAMRDVVCHRQPTVYRDREDRAQQKKRSHRDEGIEPQAAQPAVVRERDPQGARAQQYSAADIPLIDMPRSLPRTPSASVGAGRSSTWSSEPTLPERGQTLAGSVHMPGFSGTIQVVARERNWKPQRGLEMVARCVIETGTAAPIACVLIDPCREVSPSKALRPIHRARDQGAAARFYNTDDPTRRGPDSA